MKRLFFVLAAFSLLLPARAQMTPEAVMGMTPDLPSTAALLNHWVEHNDPTRTELPDSDILNEFMEKWNEANDQIQEMQQKTLAPSLQQKAMSSKVGGTNLTAAQVAGMSDAEAQKLAMSVMKSRVGGLGLSQADIAKMQGGQMSEADQKALADKRMAARTGGMTTRDIEAMSHMTEQQRMEFMQQSGLGESVTNKMEADKGKRAANKTQAALVQEMNALAQKAYRLQNEASGKITSAMSEGMDLYKKKYQKTIEDINAEIAKAVIEEEEAISAEQVRAAQAREKAANTRWINTMKAFYGEYIPIHRNAVIAAMDCCRAEMLPVLKQEKEVQEKLYAMTQSAEYSLYESTPYTAAYLYFELSKKIEDFDLKVGGDTRNE
ncbi:MAG: hypothetical protein IJ154_01970 [Bacteroidales bacterium]|nr:hypothetical protein [Bacteroidales bacterium]